MNRLRRGDQGQITTALVIIGTVVVVALGLAAAKLGQATDQKSQVQIAADAAALAGAQEIRMLAPKQILAAIQDGGGGGFDCGMGRAAASTFANRAGARLVQYCYLPSSDTVRASVESLTNSVTGSPAHAIAESRVGLTLADCVVPPRPSPNTSPTTTSSARPSTTTIPSPPPNVDDEVRCGDLSIPIVFDGASGDIKSGLSESEIRDLFPTPALRS